MKKRLSIIITVIVLLLLLIITMSTVALWKWNSSNTNVGFTISGLDAFIIYNKGTDVLAGVLDPVSSYEESAVSTEITLYKNTTKTLYGHIYLDVTTIGNTLAEESALKWAITSNGQVLNEGDFVGSSVNDSIPLKINIPLSQTEQTFKIYIWLDEGMDINDEIEGETLSTIVRAEASEVEYEVEPNSPDLVEGLVPITYSDNKWVKADSNNTDNSWYNYDNKQWANAVLVTSDYRDENNNDTFSVGDEIPEDAILAYYVWIPRCKYKVWNITKTIGTDSYDAQNTGIDIKWESGTESTGTITCNDYDFTVTNGSLSEICNGKNGEYYTHPAFTFGDDKLRGIWVGKYEISSETPDASFGGEYSITLAVRSKPNINSWRYNYVTNFSYVIQNMGVTDNQYGLNIDSNSHMIKNMEWGAVVYFTHSKFGRCSSSECEEVALNSYFGGSYSKGFKTGCGPQSEGSTNNGSVCNAYNTELGQLSSTTGNIYGIYDMSGGASEYVMGNMSNITGNYTYYASGGGSNFAYLVDNKKYVDTYANGSDNSGQVTYNRSRLGDATGEIIITVNTGWNVDFGAFVSSNLSWFVRGGNYGNGSNAGIFSFDSQTGIFHDKITTRAILVSTS